MKQTAIKWLLNNIPERYKNAFLNDCKEEIEQAKAMEEEQIKKTFNDGIKQGYANYIDTEWGRDNDYTPEQYYNETYNK